MAILTRDVKMFFSVYRFWIFNAGMFFLLFLMYGPSLRHPPNADHIVWMLEMADYNSLPDIFAHSYSWSRTRFINIGDFILFRPGLFLYLSLMKSAFGAHYWIPQLLGIVWHGIVMSLMLGIFLRFTKSAWVYFFVLFFAVISYHADMVTWTHIHPYMLALILLLISSHLILDEFEGKPRSFWVFLVLLLLAVFTFEFALIYCAVLVAVMFVLKLSRKMPALLWGKMATVLLIPIGVYLAVSAIDYAIHIANAAKSLEGSNIRILSFDFIGSYFKNVVAVAAAIISMPLVPALIPAFITTRFTERSFLLPLSGQELGSQIMSHPLNGLNVAVLGVMILSVVWIIGQKLRKPPAQNPPKHKFLLSAAGIVFLLFLGYAFMVLGGRVSDRGIGYLQRCSYHLYYLSVFLFMGLVFFWLFVCRCRPVFSRISGVFLGVSLGVLVFLNVFKVYAYNSAVAEGYADFAASLRKTHAFVDSRGEESDFSFRYLYKHFDDGMTFNFGSYRNPEAVYLHVIDALFKRHVSLEPKYYVVDAGREQELRFFLSLPEAEEFLKGLLKSP